MYACTEGDIILEQIRGIPCLAVGGVDLRLPSPAGIRVIIVTCISEVSLGDYIPDCQKSVGWYISMCITTDPAHKSMFKQSCCGVCGRDCEVGREGGRRLCHTGKDVGCLTAGATGLTPRALIF